MELSGSMGPHPQEAERYLEEWFEQHPEYEVLAEVETPAVQKTYAALLVNRTRCRRCRLVQQRFESCPV